jgi:hypothetical protein
MRKFVGVCSLAIVLSAAIVPVPAFATWTSYLEPGNTYGVRDGENAIPLGLSEKQAQRVARKLNKALSHDKGFVDPGSGPCHDPKPGTQC